MAVADIIQLRQLLAEKFPGLRTRVEELPSRSRPCWPTGLPHLDERLGGGLAKGAMTEVVLPRRSTGGASLAGHLLRQTAAAAQFAAYIDGQDSFDVTAFERAVLERLLWLRCSTADEALKAADLLLRDGNLPVVLVDLALNPEAQLRKIPAPTWYRFQRIVEERGVTSVFFTPRPMVTPAEARITLETRLELEALEHDSEELVLSLEMAVSDSRRHGPSEELLRHTA